MKGEHIIGIDSAKCVGCGQCQKDCPANNILIKDKKAAVIEQNCIKCGHCVAICPKAAVSMSGFHEQPVEIKAPTILDPKLFLEAVRSRRSIRQFTNQTVPAEIIEQIIEAGRLTPTGANAQDVSFIVLKDRIKQFEKIAVGLFRRLMPFIKLINPMVKRMTIDDDFFFKKAPAVIMILSKDKTNGSLAASNMALMAEAFGLGVLYSGFFSLAANHSWALRKKLGLGRKDQVVMTLVLGYSGVTYRRTVQKEEASVRML